MDNTINNKTTQAPTVDKLSHNDLSSALAFATNLHESTQPKDVSQEQSQQASVEPHNAPQQEKAPDTDKESSKEENDEKQTQDKMMKEMESMKTDIELIKKAVINGDGKSE